MFLSLFSVEFPEPFEDALASWMSIIESMFKLFIADFIESTNMMKLINSVLRVIILYFEKYMERILRITLLNFMNTYEIWHLKSRNTVIMYP